MFLFLGFGIEAFILIALAIHASVIEDCKSFSNSLEVSDMRISVQAFPLAPGLTLCLGSVVTVIEGSLSW